MTQREASRRTASLGLEWHNPSEDTWQADLPAIPGYTGADGNDSFVTVTYDDDGSDTPWEAVATIFPTQGGVVNLDCWTMMGFDPMGESADDVKQAVDGMDVYDFSYALDKKGIEPMVDEDGEYVVASRHATRRKANMNLDWEKDGDYGVWMAPLPYIPGYPCADGFSDSVEVADLSGLEGTGWCFTMYLSLQNEDVNLYNEDFDIPDTDTAEEMMNIIENLSPQDIADMLAEKGYMPEED